jgi:hypothetical protein
MPAVRLGIARSLPAPRLFDEFGRPMSEMEIVRLDRGNAMFTRNRFDF